MVNILKLPKYVDVQYRALNIAAQNKFLGWKGKRQGFEMNEGLMATMNKKPNMGTSSNFNQGGNVIPTCAKCGKRHRGVCRRLSRACFKCGKVGHLAKNCSHTYQGNDRSITGSFSSDPAPKPIAKPVAGRENIKQGRVFALSLYIE
ncbi:hypothetical protein ACSBR1_018043 [Camellia fascicularis]